MLFDPPQCCEPKGLATRLLVAGMDERTGPNGQTLYVATAEAERGAQAPFYVAYSDSEGARRWGYVCGNCESVATAMDSMGRIQCADCGNLKKPEVWDAAHE